MAASTNAPTTIEVNARRAVETGSPGEGIGVGGMGVFEDVGVDVGQGVIVGRLVGVNVG